jgi:hypothetical protein
MPIADRREPSIIVSPIFNAWPIRSPAPRMATAAVLCLPVFEHVAG